MAPTKTAATPDGNDSFDDLTASYSKLNYRPYLRALKTEMPEAPKEVDAEFNRAIALNGSAGDEPKIIARHEVIHSLACGQDRERFRAHRGGLDKHIEDGADALKGIGRILKGTPRFVQHPGERVPWSLGGLVGAGTLVAVSVGSLSIGCNQMASILYESGHFATKLDAAMFSTLPAGAAVVLKTISNWLPTERAKARYGLGLGIGALGAASVWGYLVVSVFGAEITGGGWDPSMGFSLASTGVQPFAEVADGAPAWAGKWLLRAAILGEVLVGAACWVALSALSAKRSPFRLALHPLHRAAERLSAKISNDLAVASDLRAQFEERLKRLDDGCKAYCQRAVTDFRLRGGRPGPDSQTDF